MKDRIRLSVYVDNKRTPVKVKEVSKFLLTHSIAEIILQSSIEETAGRVLVKIETVGREV